MEKRAGDVLRKKLQRIKDSSVDPTWLAGKLFSANIIGKDDVEKASNKEEVRAERLCQLVLLVMGNGAPGVFQTFVRILLNEPHVKWLGEELNGMTFSYCVKSV